MAAGGAQQARRRALVVGSGEVAATFATRLAWGDCDVVRRPAGPPPDGAPAGAEHDAVVLADGTGLDGADLEVLDLAAWASAVMPELRHDGVLVLAGGDGRLRGDASAGGPVAVLEELFVAVEAGGARVSALLLREVLGEDVGSIAPGPAAVAGAGAAEAVEYLASARSQAISGAVLRAPLLGPGRARRSEFDERRAVRAALAPAAAPGSRPGA